MRAVRLECRFACVTAWEHTKREAGRARIRDGVHADGLSGHGRVDPATSLVAAQRVANCAIECTVCPSGADLSICVTFPVQSESEREVTAVYGYPWRSIKDARLSSPVERKPESATQALREV